MTARFGRNKRRAAREAIAERDAMILSQRATIDRAVNDIQVLQSDRARLRDFVDELVERVIHAAGPDSGLIPFKKERRRHTLDWLPDRWSVPQRVLASYSFFEVSLAKADLTEWYVDLLELVLIMEEQPDAFRRVIRVLVKHPRYNEFEGHAAILLDRDTYRKRGLSTRDVDMLFDMYRDKLKEFIAGGGMGVPRQKAEVRHG